MADIFISYKRDDRGVAERLAKALQASGWTVWWDTRLNAGDSFDKVIERQLEAAECVVVLWTVSSVKSDWVRAEAGDGAKRQILVPVHLGSPKLPLQFRNVHTIDLTGWRGGKKNAGLAELLRGVAAKIGRAREIRQTKNPSRNQAKSAKKPKKRAVRRVGPPRETTARPNHGSATALHPKDLTDLTGEAWVELDGGSFRLREELDPCAPGRRVILPPFKILRFPVTNFQYQQFVEQSHISPPPFWDGYAIPHGMEEHPVTEVSWNDAKQFCSLLEQRLQAGYGGSVDLPTVAQWAFAAYGPARRKYPWGSAEPSTDHANFGGHVGKTTPVDTYPQGATPEGVYDLAGNVEEWCKDDYPTGAMADPAASSKGAWRLLRGRGFHASASSLRVRGGGSQIPEHRSPLIGFRVVWSSPGGPE